MFNWTADIEHINDDEERNDKIYKNNRWCFSYAVLNRSQGVAISVKDNDKLIGCMIITPSSHARLCKFPRWGTKIGIIGILRTLMKLGTSPLYKSNNGYGQHAKNRLTAQVDIIPKARERIMKHYKRWIYLQCIGVHPSAVGKGYGKKLLQFLIQTADSLKVPLYLETESESNEALFKYFGFRTAEKIYLCAKNDTIEQPMWLMIKDAKV